MTKNDQQQPFTKADAREMLDTIRREVRESDERLIQFLTYILDLLR